MKITSKGQVTIPKAIRNRLGLLSQTEVAFSIDGNAVRITKKQGSRRRGDEIVSHITGRGTVDMSTDEIMALTRNDE